MAITFKNYYVSVETISAENLTNKENQVMLLKGTSGSTIVKTLQLINYGQSCNVEIIRKDDKENPYSTIKIDLKSNDYLVLWQGFFVIPHNHTIYFWCNSLGCKAVANVVEMT